MWILGLKGLKRILLFQANSVLKSLHSALTRTKNTRVEL